MTPLRQGGSTFGYLQLSNFNVNRLVEVTELMELITFLLSSQISNHLLMERLERMSITDGLTSLLNRHAMLQRIESISSQCAGRPFGIVNIDLNGLKTVNDLDGHDAGDKVLLRASEVLRKIFRDEDLFRTGGDEFVAIVTDIDQDVFKRKVARLRADADKNDLVSFAIGAYWSDGSADIRTAFLHADELMYADKDEFYKNNPDLPRR